MRKLAQRMAERLLRTGVYVIGFSFPVVPRGQARIRTQMCGRLHTATDLDAPFPPSPVGKATGVIAR
jgi:glycine C-acetyltransferase